MPRRDIKLTIILGPGPNADDSWDQGIAVAADTQDEWGMMVGKVAGSGDDIIGWTIRPQASGDIVTLRTMLDGTINVKLGPGFIAAPATVTGDAMWLMADETGRLTIDGDRAIVGANYIALALESGKVENDYCEVYVFTQKEIINV